MIRHTVWSGLVVGAAMIAENPAEAADSESQTAPREEQSVWSDDEKSSGLAVALSLTPLPIDFGNFYANNSGWATLYTGAELGLAGTIVWFGSEQLCWRKGYECNFSTPDAWTMGALITAYVGVKIGAAVHASSAVRAYERERERSPKLALVPTSDGARAMLMTSF
jgi:hypothetical protein